MIFERKVQYNLIFYFKKSFQILFFNKKTKREKVESIGDNDKKKSSKFIGQQKSPVTNLHLVQLDF